MVAKNQPFLRISFIPKHPDKSLGSILPIFKKKWEEEINSFAKKSHKTFQQKIPLGKKRRTGRSKSTRASIELKQTTKKDSLESNIKLVGNEVVNFLDKGTKGSPGRYVPILHRRIKSGFHPGIRPLNIIQEATDDIENDANDRIRKLQRDFKFSIRTAFTRN